MATVLFIKRSDIVKNSIIDGSVDTDKFIYFIKIAQEMHIQNYIGNQIVIINIYFQNYLLMVKNL